MRRGRSVGALVALVAPLLVFANSGAVALDDCQDPSGTSEGPAAVTVAGTVANGPALTVGLGPGDLAVTADRVAVADTVHRLVREVSRTNGAITVVAGNGGDGGNACPLDGRPALSAALPAVSSITYDASGRQLIAVTTAIYRRDAGRLVRIAGSELNGNEGNDGPALDAKLDHVTGLTVHPDGSLYFVQPFDNAVRRIGTDGIIRGVASGSWSRPAGLTIKPDGTVLVADSGNARIRAIAPNGTVRTVASATGEGGSAVASFHSPGDLALESDGALIVADTRAVWRVSSVSASVIAGSNDPVDDPRPVADGDMATGAALLPVAVAIVGDEVVFSDNRNQRVMRIDDAGRLRFVAGTGTPGSGNGGPAEAAQLGLLQSVDVAPNGSIVFTDGAQVREVTPSGSVRLVAGNGAPPPSCCEPEGEGQPADQVRLNGIAAVAVDSAGLVHFLEAGLRIRRVEADGTLRTVASVAGRGLSIGPDGSIYVADTDAHRIRRVDPSGAVTTFAGNGQTDGEEPISLGGTYSGDGGPATAAGLSRPRGVAADPFGNVYIADTGNGRVRRVDANGRITTVAGLERVGTIAIDVDSAGNIYYGTGAGGTVARADLSGLGGALAGGGSLAKPPDGTSATRLRLSPGPIGVAVDQTRGDLILADNTNHVLRRLMGAAAPDRITRFAGADRLLTAVATSRVTFEAGEAQTATLARADAYADALAGAPLAVASDGPLLLTPTYGVDPVVEEELRRVLPVGGRVNLLGGTAALSADVEEQLRRLGYEPVRYAGTDRYATAVAVASRGLNNPTTVLLTSGTNFPDALAAGAAAGSEGGAVLLTAGSTMPAATGNYLRATTGRRIAVGGPAAIAAPTAERIVGVDRYDTAARVAAAFFPSSARAGLASGEAFPDALAAGARAGSEDVPLLLTQPSTLPDATRRWLEEHRGLAVEIFGGARAVTDGVRQQVQTSTS